MESEKKKQKSPLLPKNKYRNIKQHQQAGVAQLVERRAVKQSRNPGVGGSNPPAGEINLPQRQHPALRMELRLFTRVRGFRLDVFMELSE